MHRLRMPTKAATHRATVFISVLPLAIVLAGCSSGGLETTAAPPVESQLTAAPTPKPETYPNVLPTTGPESSVIPQNVQGPPVLSSTVPALDTAIDSADHPSLAICAGQFGSFVTGRGDFLSTGRVQYLVDTTCAGSTGTSPDEVAVYGWHGRTLARVAVIYANTLNRPRMTTYPFLAGPHLAVLEFDDGALYCLVGLSASGITQGPLVKA